MTKYIIHGCSSSMPTGYKSEKQLEADTEKEMLECVSKLHGYPIIVILRTQQMIEIRFPEIIPIEE